MGYKGGVVVVNAVTAFDGLVVVGSIVGTVVVGSMMVAIVMGLMI